MRILLILILSAARVSAAGVSLYTEETFASLQAQERTVLLQFYAAACPICDVQVRSLKSLSKNAGLLAPVVMQVDYHEENVLRRMYEVQAPSALLLFKGRQLIGQTASVMTIPDLHRFIRESRMQYRGRPPKRPMRSYRPKR